MKEPQKRRENPETNRLIGNLVSGYGTKLIVMILAVILAYEVFNHLNSMLAPVATAMGDK